MTFTKLFSSITESTVWCEPMATRLVWITMLAMADKRGRVYASVPGLANRARVPLAETETALATFEAPDKYSRTTDHDGRRIEPIDGGWRLLNYAKYREMRDHDDRLEYQRNWDRENRGKGKADPINPTESDKPRPDPTKAEAEAEAEQRSKALTAFAVTAFEQFWKSYPRKTAKQVAHKAFLRVKPDDALLAMMIVAIEDQKATDQWQRGIIPHAATWLNQKRWEDEVKPAVKPVDTTCRREKPGTHEPCGMPGKPHVIYGYSCEHCNLKDEAAKDHREIPPAARAALKLPKQRVNA